LDRSKKLPLDIIRAFKTSREIFGGLAMARQLVFANWDHTINQESNKQSLHDLWVQLNANITGKTMIV
jgi:hypothetical protein